jgi:predicted Rossmann-fold nucleotide-binding protein
VHIGQERQARPSPTQGLSGYPLSGEQGITDEEFDNPYVSRELHFYFHYFFMRKFWFVYVQDTIVFMGSALLRSEETAKAALVEAERVGQDIEAAQIALRLSIYYEAARELAQRLTVWSKKLGREERRFVVCTGGGLGIMEAANRGASAAKGLNVGLTISLAQGGRAVPERLWHARRAVRDPDAGPDAQDTQAHADQALWRRILERGD